MLWSNIYFRFKYDFRPCNLGVIWASFGFRPYKLFFCLKNVPNPTIQLKGQLLTVQLLPRGANVACQIILNFKKHI